MPCGESISNQRQYLSSTVHFLLWGFLVKLSDTADICFTKAVNEGMGNTAETALLLLFGSGVKPEINEVAKSGTGLQRVYFLSDSNLNELPRRGVVPVALWLGELTYAGQ